MDLWHNGNNTASEPGVTVPSITSANYQLCENGQITHPCWASVLYLQNEYDNNNIYPLTSEG